MGSTAKKISKIYALLDPRSDPSKVMYVGCTSGSVDSRLSRHIAHSKNEGHSAPKDKWLRSLLAEGLEPQCLILERVASGEDWESRERFWIARYGVENLTNVSVGGAGCRAPRTEESKKKIGDFFRGRPLTEDHKQRVRAAKMGHEVSQETREKIAKKLIGKKANFTAEDMERRRASFSGANNPRFGRRMPDDERAQMSLKRQGGRVINNGQTARMLACGEDIPNGWSIGQLPNFRHVCAGSRWFTDGTNNRRIKNGDHPPDGWRAGKVPRART